MPQNEMDNTQESRWKVVPKYLTDRYKTTKPNNIFKKRETPNANEILRGVDKKFIKSSYIVFYFVQIN